MKQHAWLLSLFFCIALHAADTSVFLTLPDTGRGVYLDLHRVELSTQQSIQKRVDDAYARGDSATLFMLMDANAQYQIQEGVDYIHTRPKPKFGFCDDLENVRNGSVEFFLSNKGGADKIYYLELLKAKSGYTVEAIICYDIFSLGDAFKKINSVYRSIYANVPPDMVQKHAPTHAPADVDCEQVKIEAKNNWVKLLRENYQPTKALRVLWHTAHAEKSSINQKYAACLSMAEIMHSLGKN